MDALATLRRDQDHIEQLIAELERTPPRDRTRVAHRLAAIYTAHAAVEAEHVYPLIRARLTDGRHIANRRRAKRKSLERSLQILSHCGPGDARFDLALWTAREQMYRDLYEERRFVLPRLSAICSDRELVALGEQIRWSRRLAPRRPHPAAPDTPPLNRLTNPVLGALDRVQHHLGLVWPSRRP